MKGIIRMAADGPKDWVWCWGRRVGHLICRRWRNVVNASVNDFNKNQPTYCKKERFFYFSSRVRPKSPFVPAVITVPLQ